MHIVQPEDLGPAPLHPPRTPPRPGSDRDVREGALARLWPMLRIGAVVGAEEPLLAHLARVGADIGVQQRRTDGVLELYRPGWEGPALCAHVDRHGLVALDDGTFGYAAHVRRDDIEDEPSHATRAFLAKVADRFDGEEMFAYDPVTGARLGRAVAEPESPDTPGRLTVHVEDLPDVPPGTPVAYTGPDHDQRTGEVLSAQLDNALPVAVAIELLAREEAGRVFLTCEEEIGRSADHLLAHLEATRDGVWPRLLVLDTSPFPTDRQAAAGAVVLRTRDAGAEFDPGVTAMLARAADDLGIEIVLKDAWIEATNAERAALGESPRGLGRTELGRLVSESEGRVRGGTVQVPTWDYHTSSESTTVRAVDAFVALLRAVLTDGA